MDQIVCAGCTQPFAKQEMIINSGGQVWHEECFVCAQCFRPFGTDGVFYEFEGRKYCEQDFHVLYAPCCGKCGQFVIGRVIRALNSSWHPECFTCALCEQTLADQGFIRNGTRPLCHPCNAKQKAAAVGKHICGRCQQPIDQETPFRFQGQVFHAYHFNCSACGVELNEQSRELRGDLFCLRCHDKMGVPVCGACHKPIDERVVTALGKHWHVEHFVCAKCEKPFLGNRHYEKKGQAYCETHYHQLFGNLCYVCNMVIGGDVFSAFNKAWCAHHFACAFCDQKLQQKSKFYDVDLKPCCKKCFDKFPSEFRKRLKKFYAEKKGV